ncbi:retroviral-like aspartic protease family protein [Entomobacter blattae]|nr:retroviral-like aspartic protease family protein [Entomobacter blattae]
MSSDFRIYGGFRVFRDFGKVLPFSGRPWQPFLQAVQNLLYRQGYFFSLQRVLKNVSIICPVLRPHRGNGVDGSGVQKSFFWAYGWVMAFLMAGIMPASLYAKPQAPSLVGHNIAGHNTTPQLAQFHNICAMQKVGEAPLRDDEGYLSVPVHIGGKAFRMIVDTGSEGSLISPQIARELTLKPDPNRKTVIYGSRGNSHVTSNVQIPEVEVGGVSFHHVSVPLGELPGRPRIFPPIVGLIGGDMLSNLEVEFDVARGRLSFYALSKPAFTCNVKPLWTGAYSSVPLSRVGHRVMLEVALDSKPLVALLDSGARTLVLSTQAAHRIGISEAALASQPGGTASSVAGQEVVYHWYRFKTFAVGDYREKTPVITVLPLNDLVDMLLGASWFANKRIWVSYGSGQLFVQGEAESKKDFRKER